MIAGGNATPGTGPTVDGDGNSVSVAGLQVAVAPIQLGSWSFPGGEISLPAVDGTWYVGVEFWSGQLRTLPRLGHRGWVPVACMTVVSGVVTLASPIQLAMPACRIPRTMAKIVKGAEIKAVVLGSSLAESSGDTTWVGMLMSASSAIAKYKLPASFTYINAAKGGAPNAYGFAQTGYSLAFNASLYDESGFPAELSSPTANGRSALFAGVDVVFVTCLANGGDYRLDLIEPTVRNLRSMGVEVVLVTDNAQGPTTAHATTMTAPLFVDGPSVMSVADLYCVELADTAAYVADAHIRSGGVGIYGDSIHMAAAAPVGPSALIPGSGHEAWARAIRGVFNVGVQTVPAGQTVRAFDFSAGLDSVVGSSVLATPSTDAGKLVITKNSASTGQWGARLPFIKGVKVGDTVRVQGICNHTYAVGLPQIGLQGGGSGWGSNVGVVPANPGGNFDVLLTANRDAGADSYVLLFASGDSSPAGTTNIWSNLVVTVTNAASSAAYNAVPGRGIDATPMPASRVVTDFKTPGQMQVILPHDEYLLRRADGNAGTLGPHPAASGSFARRWSPTVGSTQDLLTLDVGKRAAIASFGVVGFALVYYAETTTACTFELWTGSTLVNTFTFGVSSSNREVFAWLRTPTSVARNTAAPIQSALEIRVTAGTLKIAALIAATSDFQIVRPADIEFVGAWSPGIVLGGSPNMPGRSTDTLGDYARLKCSAGARRVSWIVSSKANSKPVDTWASGQSTLSQATVGANHIRTLGSHVGPDDVHYIRCAETLAGGGNASTGYALHVGGAIAVLDR